MSLNSLWCRSENGLFRNRHNTVARWEPFIVVQLRIVSSHFPPSSSLLSSSSLLRVCRQRTGSVDGHVKLSLLTRTYDIPPPWSFPLGYSARWSSKWNPNISPNYNYLNRKISLTLSLSLTLHIVTLSKLISLARCLCLNSDAGADVPLEGRGGGGRTAPGDTIQGVTP